MHTAKIPGPIASYVAAANSQDVNAVTACFSESAVVHDEGQDRSGIAAIREWAAEVSTKYQPTVEVIDIAEADGKTILAGRISGNFPGSPIALRYLFTLNDGKITRLEIA